jgi:hypothetical protein
MASTVANVLTAEPAVSGALRRAPLGTPCPTDALAVPNVAFKDLGYVGEEGFIESNKRTTTKKKAFGGSIVKVLQTDYSATIKVTLMESINADVLKAVFGDENVTVIAANSEHGTQIKVDKNRAPLPHACWLIDTIDGDATMRDVIQDGQPTDVGDIKIVNTDTIMYELTIECFEVEGSQNILTYTDDGQTTSS